MGTAIAALRSSQVLRINVVKGMRCDSLCALNSANKARQHARAWKAICRIIPVLTTGKVKYEATSSVGWGGGRENCEYEGSNIEKCFAGHHSPTHVSALGRQDAH